MNHLIQFAQIYQCKYQLIPSENSANPHPTTQRQKQTSHSNQRQKRNFSYVFDVVKATLAASTSLKTIGKIINVASEKEYKVKDIAQSLIDITKSSSEIVFFEPLQGDPPRNPADISLAKELINFETSHTFEECLEETFRDYNANKRKGIN